VSSAGAQRRPAGGLADRLGLTPEWRRAFAEVERLVGGRVVAAERQARWRPAWYLDVERGGERVPVYFRGDRGEGQQAIYGLEREADVLRVLEAHGIPVPHVFGFCPDPRGIVMERRPGRANLATAESEAERCSVLDHYVEILVEMHRIDPAAFEAIGLRRPANAAELGLADLPLWEASYRQRKSRPEPLLEFALGWLRRHVPTGRTRVAFVAGDSGQFVFENGRVTGVLDLELAFLGDPLADLAGMRNRDISEPLGDLSRAFGRYAELSGEPIDADALHFHTARFALNTPLTCAPLCAQPPPGLNLAQYLGWNLVYGRLAIEVIAGAEGILLEPPELPPASTSPHAPAHAALVEALEAGARDSYEIDSALRVALYLREIDRRGRAILAQDLDEAGALLGRRPRDRAEADAALDALAAAPPPRLEARLVRYLHRRMLREEALLRPAMRELTDIRFQAIDLRT
jgi:aminoglycoside phosphotransferase (APT) family kinase protein